MTRLSDELLAVLACPRCHGSLDYRESEAALDCRACALRFRVEGEVPVMLVEEATPIS